jgi:hypothetical protein
MIISCLSFVDGIVSRGIMSRNTIFGDIIVKLGKVGRE